jgi:hypothetical protein
VDHRADVARWRRVALRTVVAECRRADARAKLRRFVVLLAARMDWYNLTVVLTLTDAAAALGVSERTVTSMYARLFTAGLLAERVPPRSATAGPDGRPRSQARVCRLWLPLIRCEVCGTAGETAVARPVPLRTVCCDSCWRWTLQEPESDTDVATLPVGSCSCSSACRHRASAPKPRPRPCWGKLEPARTRSERLLFAERFRSETALAHDRRLSDR